MSYTCPRCGFQTKTRFNIHRHFERKVICQPLLENMSISECFRTVLNDEMKNDENCAFKCVENGCHVPQKCVQMRYDAFKCVGNNEQVNVVNVNRCYTCGHIFKHKRYLTQHIHRYKCKKNNNYCSW